MIRWLRFPLIAAFFFNGNLVWADSNNNHLPTVMITNFVPFQGKKQNGSQIVINKLLATHNLKNEPYNIYVCTLPVQYQKAANAAKDCFLKMKIKPDMVVSTGEAFCDTRLETRYHNLDNEPKVPDNGGKILSNQKIENNAQNAMASTLPLATMYCAGNGIKLSVDASNFVCNDTAYRLSEYFSKQHIPYGFIHVPNANCSARELNSSSQLLTNMLKKGLEKIKADEPAPGSCCDHKPKSSLLAELSHVFKIVTGSINAVCEKNFDNELRQALATRQH